MAAPIQLNNLHAWGFDEPRQLSYLETIIQKKTTDIALSCIESIIHWFLTTFSCCYPAYNKLYLERLSHKYLPNGSVLEDQTAGQIASLKPGTALNVRGYTCAYPDYLSLNGKKVLFSGIEYDHDDSIFDDRINRRHVVVKDSEDRPGEVIITTNPLLNDLKKEAVVDTTKIFIQSLRLNEEVMNSEPIHVYLTEEAITQIQDPNYLYPLEQE